MWWCIWISYSGNFSNNLEELGVVHLDEEPCMSKAIDIIAGTGLDQKARKSHWPARLDFVQSASGLFLGLFMWGHMAFVSTILISKDAMWWVTKMFEGYFFF